MNKKVKLSIVTSCIIATTLFIYGISNSTHQGNKLTYAETNKNTGNQETTIPNTIDGKTKVQNLMLNSIDHYKNASGTFEYLSKTANFHLIVHYQTDVSNNPRSYEKIQILPTENTEKEFDYETNTYDGEMIAHTTSNKKTKEIKVTKVKTSKISKDERDEFKNSTIKDRVKIMEDGEKAYINRVDPSYMAIAKTSLLPEDFAMGFLEDTTKWNIVGNEQIAGVNTLVIKGTLNDYYSTKYNAVNFKLNVDPKTGILLQMEATDANGQVQELIKTTEIQLNGNLNEELFIIE